MSPERAAAPVVMAIAALVAGLVYFFTQTELGQEIWAKFTTFLTEAWTNITTFLSETWANITQWFTDFGNALSEAWTLTWTTITEAVTTAVDWVKNVIEVAILAAQLTWETVWGAVSSFFTTIWETIVGAATGFMDSVKATFDEVMDFIGGVPDKVMEFFSGIGDWLVDSGSALVDGFLSGIKGAWDTLTGWVSDGLGAIRDLFPFSPAKTGPFSGSGWVDRSGAALGSTFAESVADSLKAGRKDVSSELSGIQSDFDGLGSDFQAGFRVSSAVPDVAGAAGRGGVQQVNNFAHLDPEIAVEMSARRLERELEAV